MEATHIIAKKDQHPPPEKLLQADEYLDLMITKLNSQHVITLTNYPHQRLPWNDYLLSFTSASALLKVKPPPTHLPKPQWLSMAKSWQEEWVETTCWQTEYKEQQEMWNQRK